MNKLSYAAFCMALAALLVGFGAIWAVYTRPSVNSTTDLPRSTGALSYMLGDNGNSNGFAHVGGPGKQVHRHDRH